LDKEKYNGHGILKEVRKLKMIAKLNIKMMIMMKMMILNPISYLVLKTSLVISQELEV
jgi:hypothetical protein